MANMAQLVAAATATTNPAPSTLAPVNPYANATANRFAPQASWTTQAKPALLSKGSAELVQPKNRVDFIPSSAAATYTVTLWVLNRLTGTWLQPSTGAVANFTGPTSYYIDNMGNDAWFIQLSSISAGTVQISYDSRFLSAL